MLNYKESFIILDGVDKTGKDTIDHKIIETTNGKILTICRGPISQIAYSKIYGRNLDINYYYKLIQKLHFFLDAHFFLLTADDNILLDRCYKYKEKDFEKQDDFDIEKIRIHKHNFIEVTKIVIESYKTPVYEIDTGKYSIKECTDQILEIIGKK